jgi:hypothetical protein
MALIIDPDDLGQGEEISIDTGTRTYNLYANGALSTDGVTQQCVYSFFKEEWKTDAALNPHPFPMIAITPEQFEYIYDWEPADTLTRNLLRTGGWKEVDTEDSDRLKREYMGVITLGSFEDEVNDNAYYEVGSDPTVDNTTDFVYAGPVNEAILTYEENIGPAANIDFVDGGGGEDQITWNDANTTNDWITNGYVVGGAVTILGAANNTNSNTYTVLSISGANNETINVATASLVADTTDTTARAARNYRSAIKVFLRVRDGDTNGKTYAQSTLADIGVTTVTNQVYRFPITNATDLKIAETDANIAANPPYTQIVVRYFDTAFQRDIDTFDTPRNFGIVVDVGTHSGVDGALTDSNTLTSAEGTIPATTYDGGTLTVHNSSFSNNNNTYTITTATGTTVDISGTFADEEPLQMKRLVTLV